jgi:hypothetical protein
MNEIVKRVLEGARAQAAADLEALQQHRPEAEQRARMEAAWLAKIDEGIATRQAEIEALDELLEPEVSE